MNRRNASLVSGLVMALAACAAFTSGCSFAARSSQMYSADTLKVLETKSPQLKVCYDDALKTDPSMKGMVYVRFSVEKETGKFKDPKLDPSKTTTPPVLSDCVMKSLEGLVLAPGDAREGDATFSWQFGVGADAAGGASAKAGGQGIVSGGGAVNAKYMTMRPSVRFSKTGNGNGVRAMVLGIIDPATSKPIDLKPGETLTISEDGKDVPLTVVPRDTTKKDMPIDLVFVVDNSGSMGEEADGVASKIVAFAKLLQSSGLDSRFAVVGQNGKVTGAIDFDSDQPMEAYLTRKGVA
jgi:hypothetical protein